MPEKVGGFGLVAKEGEATESKREEEREGGGEREGGTERGGERVEEQQERGRGDKRVGGDGG